MKFCGNCGWEVKPLKTGIYVETYAKRGAYEIYAADLHQCIQCGNKVIITGIQPVAVQGQSHYENFKVDRKVHYAELLRSYLNGEYDPDSSTDPHQQVCDKCVGLDGQHFDWCVYAQSSRGNYDDADAEMP